MVVFDTTCGTGASAHATVDAGTHQVTAVTLDNPYTPATPATPASGGYSGYTCTPTVTFINPPGTYGVGAQVAVVTTTFNSIPVLTKAEQELFDASGRYNSTGGVELPLTSGVIQTTVPLNYIDSATEIIKDNEVQIWKLVDNGFWSNSIHFDMVDVQLINRVGWDGTVKAPATNEVGWKDTLRLNPLEDVLVAMRAKRPAVPFGLPQSKRLLDPSKPVNTTNTTIPAASGLGFTAAAGVTPALQSSNVKANFDNEFTWNSAILGHSENDLTRPVVFQPTVLAPDAPSNLTDPLGNGTLTWTDPTPARQLASPVGVVPAVAATLSNPQNEIGFKILQASLAADGKTWSYTPFLVNGVQVTVPANTTSWTQPAANIGKTAFAVVTYNAAGDSIPSTPFADALPLSPTSFNGIATAYNSVTLSWTNQTTNNSIQVWRDGVLITTLPGAATSYVDATVTAVMTYNYTLTTVNKLGTASAGPVTVITPMIPVAAPTGLSATPNAAGTSVAVRWTDNANNETAYWVEVSSDNGVTFGAPIIITRTAAQKAATLGNVLNNVPTTPGRIYVFRVTAVNVTGAATSTSAQVTSLPVDMSAPAAPIAPTGLVATLASATRVNLSWIDNANSENSYLVTITNNVTGVTTTATVNRGATQSLATGGTVNYPATVALGSRYTFTVVAQATKFGLTTASTAAGPVTVDVSVPLAPTSVAAVSGIPGSRTITVKWTDAPLNATNYTVQRATVIGGVAGVYGNVGTVAVGIQTFVDNNRTSGRTYQYQVRANGVIGNSVFVVSNPVVAP
jgi:hypothetical protein